jgi:hypothetical protein
VTRHRLPSGQDSLRGTLIPSIGVDGAGTVYLVWDDCRFRASCSGNDLVVSSSAAPGAWTAPRQIALGEDGNFLLPGLAVDGAHLALAYYRLGPDDCSGADCRLTAGLASSADNGRTWRTADVGQPMALDWLAPTRLGKMVGDYMAAVLLPGRAVGIFSLASRPQGAGLGEAIAAAAMPIVEPPRNVRLPLVAGSADPGHDVTCQAGTWSGKPTRYAYRWLRGGRPIAGAVGRSYRVRARDVGSGVACRVVATSAAGSGTATSRGVRVRPFG